MNIYSKIKYWYIRKISPGFRVGKNDLVVDIGSGDKPFWRADVFVDKLSLNNVQRDAGDTIKSLGIFVDRDVEKLPFKNKSFDFSFCSHLLEHVDNPDKVLKEIIRVSKSGYVEVPNGILETIKPFASHLWFVYLKKDTLIFIRKSKYMHSVLSKNGLKYERLIDEIKEPFIRIYWKDSIKYEIHDIYKIKDKYKSEIGKDNDNVNVSFKVNLLVIKLLRILFYSEKNSIEHVFVGKKRNRN